MDIKKATAIVDRFAREKGYYTKFAYPIFKGMLRDKYVFKLARNGKGTYMGVPFMFLVSSDGRLEMIKGVLACDKILDSLTKYKMCAKPE